MAFALDDNSLSSNFWCKRGLNLRSLIQLSETLPVEIVGTHKVHLVGRVDKWKDKKWSDDGKVGE